MKGKPQSAEEVVEENYPLMGFWGRDDLPRSGQPMRSFLMFPSMIEEAIHLPPAPDMFGEG